MAVELIEATAQMLRGRGERLTVPRVAVLEALAGRHDHLTAEQVVIEVGRSHPAVHRASVYRALEALGELGVLTHVHLGHGGTAYHVAPPHLDEHLHAQCRACGRVVDLPADTLDPVVAEVAAATGFQLTPGHVALSGLCADCAGDPGRSSRPVRSGPGAPASHDSIPSAPSKGRSHGIS